MHEYEPMSKAQADAQIKPPWLLYICIPVPQLNDLKYLYGLHIMGTY
jgi:hypothetical protein